MTPGERGVRIRLRSDRGNRSSISVYLADPNNPAPPVGHSFQKNLSFARHEMKKIILSHLFNARPTVSQPVVSPMLSPIPAPITTRTNRGSSISQCLRAAKEILQDVVSDTEYV